MRVTHEQLFEALRALIQWGDLAELPLDDDSDYVGPKGLRNGLDVSPETQTVEGAARLLRYVQDRLPVPTNVGRMDELSIINRWIEENPKVRNEPH